MDALSATAEGKVRLANLRLAHAKPEEAAGWDEFVERHPEGRFCHLWGYKRALEQAYGYQCLYLNILDGEERIGVFPSIIVRRGQGRLISQPFNEYGGPLCLELSGQEQKSLARLLMHAAEAADCSAIEIRGGIGCEGMAETDVCVRHPLHSYAVLNLQTEEQLWQNLLTHEARKGVNRARNAGLTIQVRLGARAVEAPFYDLYLASMKRLGVPPHPPQFFSELAEGLNQHLVATWVMSRGQPVATLLGAVTGQRVHIFVTTSDSQAWSMRPNDLAHWELIRWAVSAGLRVFDFGSARYSGQIQFKKKWGASLHEYSYYSIGPPAFAALPNGQMMETSSPFMSMMSYLWRRIVPGRLAGALGPPIRRYLTK